jgi:hypothetical protein
MEKEKIIEEMARDICECYNNDGICYQDDMPCDLRCEHMTEAQFLYDKGYRKHNEMFTIKMNGQSELQKVFDELLEGNTYVKQKQGNWIIAKMMRTVWNGIDEEKFYYKCSICKYKDISSSYYNYCPNCGAKMKGE